jgi:hypothetical protein
MATGATVPAVCEPLEAIPTTTGCAFPLSPCDSLEAIFTTTGRAKAALVAFALEEIPTTTGFPCGLFDTPVAIPITTGDRFFVGLLVSTAELKTRVSLCVPFRITTPFLGTS